MLYARTSSKTNATGDHGQCNARMRVCLQVHTCACTCLRVRTCVPAFISACVCVATCNEGADMCNHSVGNKHTMRSGPCSADM